MLAYILKRIDANEQGSAFSLLQKELPREKLTPKQLRIKIHYLSLNYRDLLVLRGQYKGVEDGTVPLSDGAGEVIEVGDDVTEFSVGDRVVGCFFQNWEDGLPDSQTGASALGGALPGMLAQEVVFAEKGIVKVPDYLSFAEAACLPCAALTAWNALFTRGRLTNGQKVLVQGTGGVALFALQFAVAVGAKVIVLSSSDSKLERAKQMGAWAGINYQQIPEWDKEIASLTDGQGVEHVVELGGARTIEKSLACLSNGGHLALIGVLSGADVQINPLSLRHRQLSLSGIFVGSRQQFIAMNQFLKKNKIHPVIDREFNFNSSLEAYKYLESSMHFGKVVIRV